MSNYNKINELILLNPLVKATYHSQNDYKKFLEQAVINLAKENERLKQLQVDTLNKLLPERIIITKIGEE